ncbi:MAG TPA: iron uptake porin, partial [Coleofasciculaceae cyanobacterium]
TVPSPPEKRQEKSSSSLASPAQLTQLRQIFTDVNPNQWAYESIQSLAIRFGCLVGYPDDTFRGDQKLSRNEFAAGLNNCLDKIDVLMQQRTENLVTKEQLAELFRVLSDIFDKNPGLRKVPNSGNNSTPAPAELIPVLPPVTEPIKQK